MFPLVSELLAPKEGYQWVTWTVLMGVIAFRTLLDNGIFTSVMILVSTSAKPGQLGRVNGVAQGASSLARTFGPALGGIIWAWSNQNSLPFPFNHVCVFTFIFAVTGILAIQSFVFLYDGYID
ncbi:hypothetical protein HK103_004222 [Boothiomyces macroporosus]|uniref:Major facilitator superfamily (MFS) profile domain-containing protein n=1 Tax=Boothiomyces macroporosus TaxID=261099 RepID=A0AAD5Y613_9FUNG|nr:hypothetical protein HK103_004222 [Boothiomyces macroporosus]